MHVKTCSVECGYKERFVHTVAKEYYTCENCGELFADLPGIVGRRTYCSRDCMYTDPHRSNTLSERVAGDKNPNWKGGVSTLAISNTGRFYHRSSHAIENACSGKRRATKLNATPAWADLVKIKKIYAACQQISEATGILHHVDHIVPLQGESVSGLHVEYNLHIIPATENLIKANKF